MVPVPGTLCSDPDADAYTPPSLWTLNYTHFTLHSTISRDVMPALQAVLGHVLPLSLALLLILLLTCRHATQRYDVTASRDASDQSSRDATELTACVAAILGVMVALEGLRGALAVTRAFLPPPPGGPDPPWMYYCALVARCCGRVRCMANFVLLTAMCRDFRAAFRQTFCCCCCCCDCDATAEEYDEKKACCGCGCGREKESPSVSGRESPWREEMMSKELDLKVINGPMATKEPDLRYNGGPMATSEHSYIVDDEGEMWV